MRSALLGVLSGLAAQPCHSRRGLAGPMAENLGRTSCYDATAIDHPIVGCPPMGEVILGLCQPVLCLSDTCVEAVCLTISGIYKLVGIVPTRSTSQLNPVHASLRSPASHQACGNGTGLARAAQPADPRQERYVARLLSMRDARFPAQQPIYRVR